MAKNEETKAEAEIARHEESDKKIFKAMQEQMKAMQEKIEALTRATTKAVTGEPTKEATEAEDKNGEAEVKKLVRQMEKRFGEMKKVKIKLPIDRLNPKDLTVFAQLNGFTFTMKRGVEIEVPEVIKDLLVRYGEL